MAARWRMMPVAIALATAALVRQGGAETTACTLPRLDLALAGAVATFQSRFWGQRPVLLHNVPLAPSCTTVSWQELNRSHSTQATAEVDSLGIARQGAWPPHPSPLSLLCCLLTGRPRLPLPDPRSVQLGASQVPHLTPGFPKQQRALFLSGNVHPGRCLQVMQRGCFPTPGSRLLGGARGERGGGSVTPSCELNEG
jgi:hypothetical protein